MSDEQRYTSRASSLSSPLDPVGKSNRTTRMMANENEYERNEDDDEEDYDEEEEEPTTTAKIEYYYEDEGDNNTKRNGVGDTKIMKQYFLGSYPNDESESVSKINEKKASSRRNLEKSVDKHQRHRQASSNREEKKLAKIFFFFT